MKKSLTVFGIVIFLSVILSGFLTYYSLKFQVGKIWLYTVDQEQVKKINSMLYECTWDNFLPKRLEYGDRLAELDEYVEVLKEMSKESPDALFQLKYSQDQIDEILSKFSYSEIQASEMGMLLRICIHEMDYMADYKRYIANVHSNVDKMMNVKFFADNNRNQIMKAGKDFYGLENVKIQVSVDVGLEKLLETQIGNAIAMCCLILCAWVYCVGCREAAASGSIKNAGIMGYTLLMVLGLAGIFLAEIYAVDVSWMLGNVNRSVQSVDFFQSCPYLLSVGMLVGIRVLFKCLAMTILFLVCVGFFSAGSRMRILVMLFGIAVAEILLKILGMPYLFQGLLHSEEILGKYGNVLLFGYPVSSVWILVFLGIVMLVLAAIFAGVQQRGFLLQAREKAEQKYFEEVDERYTETRMLRHDINNHLSAMAILLKENKTEDAAEYLQQVMDYFDTTRPPVRTGVNVLDAVLLGKVNQAKEKNIKVELDFRENFAASRIPDHELCSVFGNLLDNAITACEKITEDKRIIKLQVSRQLEMLCIFCENPYVSVQKENGRFVTQKADSKNHGMGIRQLERIAAKYEGTVDIHTKDGKFAVSVLLCDKAEKGS